MSRSARKMVRVPELIPGMVTASVVLSGDGQVLLNKGAVLYTLLIERLKYWNIQEIEVVEPQDHILGDVQVVDMARQPFYSGYCLTVQEVKMAFDRMRYFKEVPIGEMKDLVNHSITSLVDSLGVVNHLYMIRQHQEQTFHHSVNVSIIAGVLGRWLGYTNEDLKDVILAGLLHDIGKTQIPLEILNKPDKLLAVEMEVMKQHTVFGYYLVKEEKSLSPAIINAILQHHERIDGSGYPMKMKMDKIDSYARIVAVADIYDAMTTDRVYRDRMTPFAVLETLLEDMFDKLDPKICMTFLINARTCLIGNVVRLSDGREAEVMCFGQPTTIRPIVKTLEEEVIDLDKHKELSIVEML